MYLGFTSPAGPVSSVTVTSTDTDIPVRNVAMFATEIFLGSTLTTSPPWISSCHALISLTEFAGRDEFADVHEIRGGEPSAQSRLSRLRPNEIRLEPRLHQPGG